MNHPSHTILEEFIVKFHAYPLKYQFDSSSKVRECSFCEDAFVTNEEFKSHVSDHIEEIKDIDIDYLKSGNELFVCHICNFQLKKNSENIKNCLTEQTITLKLAATNNLKTKEEVKAFLKTDD